MGDCGKISWLKIEENFSLADESETLHFFAMIKKLEAEQRLEETPFL